MGWDRIFFVASLWCLVHSLRGNFHNKCGGTYYIDY
ncbi:hypothetical protein GLYMA_10G171550v4 [Glycine max]|nr:hypothetical protein GLYMA_10G171550v4 [Glycine max]KAH1138710.1 hypothetical protein GYH30_028273 [Glycine max]